MECSLEIAKCEMNNEKSKIPNKRGETLTIVFAQK